MGRAQSAGRAAGPSPRRYGCLQDLTRVQLAEPDYKGPSHSQVPLPYLILLWQTEECACACVTIVPAPGFVAGRLRDPLAVQSARKVRSLPPSRAVPLVHMTIVREPANMTCQARVRTPSPCQNSPFLFNFFRLVLISLFLGSLSFFSRIIMLARPFKKKSRSSTTWDSCKNQPCLSWFNEAHVLPPPHCALRPPRLLSDSAHGPAHELAARRRGLEMP